MRIPVKNIKILSDFRESQERLGELAISIKQNGLLQPIVLRQVNNDLWEVAAGRRRFRALTDILGLNELMEGKHFVVRNVDSLIGQLEENIKRENFKPLEIANLIYSIHSEKVSEFGPAVKGHGGGWSIKDTAKLVSMGPSTVAQYIKMWEHKDLVSDKDNVAEAIEKVRKAKATNMLNRVRAIIASKIKKESIDSSEYAKRNIAGFKLDDAINFMRQIDRVDHIITEPPYDIRLDDLLDGDVVYEIYKDSEKDYINLMQQCVPEWYKLINNGFIMVWCAFRHFEFLRQGLTSVGFKCALTPLIWIKTNAAGSTKHPDKIMGSSVECAVYGWKGNPCLARKGRSNLFKHPTIKSERIHIAQKPDSLCKEILLSFTNKNDIVLDCFAGSGSMLRACIATERLFLGCEKDEKNYNAALTATMEMIK